jgi:hypothetical protein
MRISRWGFAAAMLSASLSAGGLAHAGSPPAAGTSASRAAVGEVSFDSDVPLAIWALTPDQLDPKIGVVYVGRTPAEAPLVIPPCRWWAVSPMYPLNMDDVLQEVQRHMIPGLCLQRCEACADETLAQVGALMHLKLLDVSETRVTDAGLAHLVCISSA